MAAEGCPAVRHRPRAFEEERRDGEIHRSKKLSVEEVIL